MYLDVCHTVLASFGSHKESRVMLSVDVVADGKDHGVCSRRRRNAHNQRLRRCCIGGPRRIVEELIRVLDSASGG